jgi:hypothetical protein
MNIFSEEFRDVAHYLEASPVRIAVADEVNGKEQSYVGRLKVEEFDGLYVHTLRGEPVPLRKFKSVRLTGLFDAQDEIWNLVCDEALDITVELLQGLSRGTRFPIEAHLSGSLLEIRGLMGIVWVTTEQVQIPQHLLDLAPRMRNIIATAISNNPSHHEKR